MAAEITETEYDIVPNFNGRIIKFKFTGGATTADWVIFPNPIGAVRATIITGAEATSVYSSGILHTSGIATVTSTSALYDNVTANQMPASGYIRIDNGEIIKYSGVTKSGTSGTMTLDERGCFGTTAATAAENDVFYILNTLIFASTVGPVRGIAEIIDE